MRAAAFPTQTVGPCDEPRVLGNWLPQQVPAHIDMNRLKIVENFLPAARASKRIFTEGQSILCLER